MVPDLKPEFSHIEHDLFIPLPKYICMCLAVLHVQKGSPELLLSVRMPRGNN